MSRAFPSKNKRIDISNRGDLFGTLVRTKNLDFNHRGHISLAKKPMVLYSETQDVDFETPLTVLNDDDNIYVVTSENVFKIGSLTSVDQSVSDMNDDGGSPPSGSFASDGVFFNGELHASDSGGVHSHNGSTWASDITGLDTGAPHPLCVSEHQQYLAVGNGNSVRLYNTSYVLQTTMTIPSDHVVTWIRWRANILWCGTRNIEGRDARVYLWDGSGTAAQTAYGVGAEWAYSGEEYLNTIVVVNSIGQILRFAGDGFVPLRTDAGEEVAFPVYWTDVPWGSSASTSNLVGKLGNRSIGTKGRRIYFYVNSEIEFNNGKIPDHLPEFPGGLWVFDPAVGLYHKAGNDHRQFDRIQVNSRATNTLTIASAAVFETGDPIAWDGASGINETDSNEIYYAIKVSSTQLKLAWTPEQAKAGDEMTLTGTPTSNYITFNVYESVGGEAERGSGLGVIKAAGMHRFNGIEVVWGGDTENATGSTVASLNSLGMGRNVGYFVTPWVEAENVKDVLKKITAKFPFMNLPTQKIIIKYRFEKRYGSPGRQDMNNGVGTWTDSNTFTVNPLQYDVYSLQVGDEIQILKRSGAGYMATVSAITETSSTVTTIDLEESLPDITASDTLRFRHENWTKYKTISTADDAKAAAEGWKKMLPPNNRAKHFQFKVVIEGYSDHMTTQQMDELFLLTGADQKYT